MEGNNTIIIFLFCIIGIIIFGKIFITPIKRIMKLVVNSLLGGFLIVIINYIGEAFNFQIGLNIATRSDAISKECYDYLEELNKKTNLIV